MEPTVKAEIGNRLVLAAPRSFELVLAMALALGTPVSAAVGNAMIDFANMFHGALAKTAKRQPDVTTPADLIKSQVSRQKLSLS